MSGFATLRGAGNRLGWKSSWIETVLGECLAVVLAWHWMVADLTSDALEEFDIALSCTTVPPSSRRAYRARLASLRQLLFETAVIDTAPRRRRRTRSLEQRFTEVAMPNPIRQRRSRTPGKQRAPSQHDLRRAGCGESRTSGSGARRREIAWAQARTLRPPSTPTGPRTTARPTSTKKSWPAAPTTASPKTDGPSRSATETPNGSHPHTSTPAKPAPTSFTTPNASSQTPTTTRSGQFEIACAQRRSRDTHAAVAAA
ncbi:MAG: hypothetical protein QOI01_811 [Mycobacterium sp.]|jgi:hypothetical protein|nr:hypothetical protein [Mycobacterium sp.]